MKFKWLLVVLVVGIALLATSVAGTKVTHAATSSSVVTVSAKVHNPASTANVMYFTFGADLGPYCVAAQKTNGQVIIYNGVASVKWRYNFSLGGYDRLAINDGKWITIDPKGVHKLATWPCWFVP